MPKIENQDVIGLIANLLGIPYSAIKLDAPISSLNFHKGSIQFLQTALGVSLQPDILLKCNTVRDFINPLRDALEQRYAKEQAAKEQAAKEQAAKEQAAKEQAAKEQAAKEQDAKEQAAKEQDAIKQLVKEYTAKELSDLNCNKHHVHDTKNKPEVQDVINVIANTLKLPPSDLKSDTPIGNVINISAERIFLWLLIEKKLHISLPPEILLRHEITVQGIIDSIDAAEQSSELHSNEQQAIEQHTDL